jgi:hypothetical protein
VHLVNGEWLTPMERFLRACRQTTGTRSVLVGGRSANASMTVAMPHETYDVEDGPEPDRR